MIGLAPIPSLRPTIAAARRKRRAALGRSAQCYKAMTPLAGARMVSRMSYLESAFRLMIPHSIGA